MGKIRNLCMTQLVRMKKIKEPDMYTWIFSSVDNCYYNYNSRYLFEYVKEHLPPDLLLFCDLMRKDCAGNYRRSTVNSILLKRNQKREFDEYWRPVYGLPQQDSRYMDRGLEGIV